MKLTITRDKKILKTIDLTNLQLKAIQLTGQKPENYIAGKLERILEYAVNQAKQTIDRISPLTDEAMEDMLETLEAEKVKPKEETR